MRVRRTVHSYAVGSKYTFCGEDTVAISKVGGDCVASLRDLFGDGRRPIREGEEKFCETCFAHEVFQREYSLWLLGEV